VNACCVANCDYVVEGYIEDFPVCSLHNARQTRLILERLELPCAAYMDERPIVYLAGIDLTEEHFVPKPSREGLRAWEDPRMSEVPGTPSRKVHPDFDLTHD
jgi:hypothetical protein